MTFEVRSPFRLYSEVSYQFLTGTFFFNLVVVSVCISYDKGSYVCTISGDLAIDIIAISDESSTVHSGRQHLNRQVVAMDYLPPGRTTNACLLLKK